MIFITMQRGKTTKIINFILIAVAVLLLDQASKVAVMSFLMQGGQEHYQVLPHFNLVYLFNYGITFGIFAHLNYGKYIFAGISSFIALLLLILVWRLSLPRRVTFAYSIIAGGALGNVLDRLVWGGVFDFLDFHWANYHYPAFNLADMAIVMGVAILLWHELRKTNS